MAPEREGRAISSSAENVVKLAPSDLTFLWEECQRCFWLKARGVLKRPAGIFPQVFTMLDNQTKDFFYNKRAEEMAEGLRAGRVAFGDRWVRSRPVSVSTEECAKYEEPFNRLAQYRLERTAKPDRDGATRWRCPFHAGRLRSRDLPWTMRGSRNTPLVPLRAGSECCEGTVTASAAELPHWQRFFPGTTAWRISYGRRQVVENVNGMLKGGFVNIQHKFFRVFGLAKMKLLLAFTVVGYNLDAIRSFVAKTAAKAIT